MNLCGRQGEHDHPSLTLRGARATLRRAPRGRELGRACTRGVMRVAVRVSTITFFDVEGGEGNPAQGSAGKRCA